MSGWSQMPPILSRGGGSRHLDGDVAEAGLDVDAKRRPRKASRTRLVTMWRWSHDEAGAIRGRTCDGRFGWPTLLPFGVSTGVRRVTVHPDDLSTARRHVSSLIIGDPSRGSPAADAKWHCLGRLPPIPVHPVPSSLPLLEWCPGLNLCPSSAVWTAVAILRTLSHVTTAGLVDVSPADTGDRRVGSQSLIAHRTSETGNVSTELAAQHRAGRPNSPYYRRYPRHTQRGSAQHHHHQSRGKMLKMDMEMLGHVWTSAEADLSTPSLASSARSGVVVCVVLGAALRTPQVTAAYLQDCKPPTLRTTLHQQGLGIRDASQARLSGPQPPMRPTEAAIADVG
ncbi:hypothetical protein CSOJ01_07322 [Colletotrichum sojae]|uniref:Uncharacterized protein n=1 Tax=Colletotrichum sojae TaxID=2175907 RepID=A0A8H6J9U2_9PEZI|nr:hypothetical protein CSOJ01_07322 [Colletotrichum sojae]